MKKIHTVLLIDDDRICNTIHSLLIKGMNLAERIIVKQNGKEALDFLKMQYGDEPAEGPSIHPDLILLDINMPIMSGFELLEELNKLEEFALLITNNIVILSSSVDPRDIQTARKLGVDKYIPKPLTGARLTQLLNQFQP